MGGSVTIHFLRHMAPYCFFTKYVIVLLHVHAGTFPRKDVPGTPPTLLLRFFGSPYINSFQTRKLILLSRHFIDGRTNVQPFSYIPFGVGSRICIGNKFAMMEMKVMLATLLKAFSFSEVPGCTVKAVPMLTARPEGLKLLIRLAGPDNWRTH